MTYKDSPNVGWTLPETVDPFVIDNLFSEEMYSRVLNAITNIEDWGPYHTISGRWVGEVDLDRDIWGYLEKKARESWGKQDIKLKNIWFAKYQRQGNVTPYLWEHMDQAGSQYLMDICIKSHNLNWAVNANGKEYPEKENSAICFMAQQQEHSRPPYPSKEEDSYVIVMFAMFADSSHWVYDIDMYDEEDIKKWNDCIRLYYLDAEIRYYEKFGYAASHADLPEGNYTCPFTCTQCHTVEPDFIEKIPGYVHVI